MLEPPILQDGAIETALGDEARPDADHGMEVHGVQFLVHRHRIWPLGGIHIHLPHDGVVKPVDNEVVDRVVAIAISVRDTEKFGLTGIALLTLNVAVCRFREHGG